MNRRYSKKSKAAIYTLMLLLVLASFLLLVFVCTVKSHIALNPSGAAAEVKKTFKDGKVFVEMSHDSFNAFVSDFVKTSTAFNEGVKIYGTSWIFSQLSGEETDKLYVNMMNERFLPSNLFSFVLYPVVELGDTSVKISISDIRFGKYEIPVLGGLLWKWMELPESIEKEIGGLLRAKELKGSQDGRVTLVYAYNEDELAKTMTDILSLSDDRKIHLHRANGDINEELLSLCLAKAASYDEAIGLIKAFEQTPDTFFDLCMLLNEDGINMLWESFGENYYSHIPPIRLAQLSDEEINSDLNQYHKDFSKRLLQYLYDNPDYYVYNGELYKDGTKITAEAVISAKGGVSGAYITTIKADFNSLSAVYTLSGFETERIIFDSN